MLTNSFGANEFRLSFGDEDKADQINYEAAQIAKKSIEKSTREVFIAGSIGPTGEIIEPLGDLSKEKARDAFLKQSQALKAGGVDFLWIETMSSEEEMEAALLAAQETSLPIICSTA